MPITSLTITRKEANIWVFSDNETPEGEYNISNAYSDRVHGDRITLITKSGGIIYNLIPYWVIEYVDEVDPENTFTPTSALQLHTYLDSVNFFGSSSGEGGATAYIELSDTPSSYFGNEGKFARAKLDGTGMEFYDIGDADQDNIDITKYFKYTAADTQEDILAHINGISDPTILLGGPYTVNAKQSVWFVGTQVGAFPPKVIKYKMKNAGKGTYGNIGNISGTEGTALSLSNLELVYSGSGTITDVENDPSTVIQDYGDIEGQTISEWLNGLVIPIDIQSQEDGYTLFQGTVDTVPTSYLWVGDAGTYGDGEVQSTMADFLLIEDVAPEPATPTLQAVTDAGNSTDNDIVLEGSGEELTLTATGSSYDKGGFNTSIDYIDPVANAKYSWPAKTANDTIAMLSDIDGAIAGQDLQAVLDNGSTATITENLHITANGANLILGEQGGVLPLLQLSDEFDNGFYTHPGDATLFSNDTAKVIGQSVFLSTNAGGEISMGNTTMAVSNFGGGILFTVSAGNGGAAYAADYSADYTNRSLVDKEYVDTEIAEALTGIYRPAGNWDASGGTFPTTGTGAGGEVMAGNTYKVSVAGTMGGVAYDVGDTFYAVVDEPGQTAGNWSRFDYNTEQATEGMRGTAEIATQAETDAGTDDEKIVTPLKLEQKLSSEYIPLSGTTIGNPVSGEIEFTANNGLYSNDVEYERNVNLGYEVIVVSGKNIAEDITVSLNIDQAAGTAELQHDDGTNIKTISVGNTISIVDATSGSRGLTSENDFTANITDLDYTQKKYVDESIGAVDLQAVTDNGNSTTNTIEVVKGGEGDLFINCINTTGTDSRIDIRNIDDGTLDLRFINQGDVMAFIDSAGNSKFETITTSALSIKQDFINPAAPYASFDVTELTAQRNYILPDADGTIALEGYVDEAVAGTIKILHLETADSSTITGTTDPIIVGTALLPAGITAGLIKLAVRIGKTTNAGLVTTKIYLNTTPDLTGAPVQVGQYTTAANNNRLWTVKRTFNIKGATITGHSFTTDTLNDDLVSAVALGSTAISTGVNNYLLVTVALANTSDTVVCDFYEVVYNKQ